MQMFSRLLQRSLGGGGRWFCVNSPKTTPPLPPSTLPPSQLLPDDRSSRNRTDKRKKDKQDAVGHKANFLNENLEVISKILEVSPDKKKIPTLSKITEESARKTVQILKEQGFGVGEISNFPKMFTMSPRAALNYITILRESCFYNFGLQQVYKFHDLHKTSLDLLEQNKIAPPHILIIENYLKVLRMQSKQELVWKALPLDIGKLRLIDLRKIVMTQYIFWKFEEKIKAEEIAKIFIRYPKTNSRSFAWIKESLQLLQKDNLFTNDKILGHSYLLLAFPSNTRRILETLPSLSGIPLRDILTARPKVLSSPYDTLIQIQQLFEEHGIAAESIAKHPELYTLSAATLKARLQDIDDIPEFRPLKTHHRVSRLLYYSNKAKARLAYLKEIKVEGATLNLLATDSVRFKKHTSYGEFHSRGHDTVSYLCNYFSQLLPNVTSSTIRESLDRVPHWVQSSRLNDLKETLAYLEEMRVFDASTLMDALPILLYPKDKIQSAISTVLDSQEATLKDPFFLHMTLYYLERLVHFSGDGVWGKNHPKLVENDPEEEEDATKEIIFGESLQETVKKD